jgi:ATP-dependent Clp protease adapter protein ClpS
MKTFSGPLLQQQDPNRVSPVDKPGLDLLEKDEVKAKRPSMWNIVFYNDDYTPMDFVEFVLKTVFHMIVRVSTRTPSPNRLLSVG